MLNMTSLIHKNNLSSVDLSTKVIKTNVGDLISICTQVGEALRIELTFLQLERNLQTHFDLVRIRKTCDKPFDQEHMCGNNTIQKIHYQGSKLTLLSSIWMKA
jgi:hypothetical protein